MKRKILSILLSLCVILAFMPQMAFAETTTGTNDADKFSWDNATVYYLVTDRFKNGDTKNDHSYGRGLNANGNVITEVDDRGTFHGGDFVGITQAINEGYFDNLGVNVLCISAAYEQIHGYIVGDDGRPSFAHYSYHGNYVLDYTNTDESFGSKEEFQTLVDTAHKHGLRVVMDVVMNHAGNNTLYDMDAYGFGTLKAGWDNYYYGSSSIDKEKYNSYIDYNSSAADWANWWGSGWVRASLPSYTKAGSDNYTMSYCGLPDFKTESTKAVGIPKFLETKWTKEGTLNEKLNKYGSSQTVTNHISKWLSSWVREYGIDGFRCDTAEYVDLASWNTLKTMCTEALREWKKKNSDKALDNLDFWMTGECQNHGINYDDYYTQGGFDSMINSDTAGGEVLSLNTVAGKYNDYAAAVNTNENFNVLSSISSDNTTLARGDQKYLGSALLLLPGGVQIFYGDESNRPFVSGVKFDGNGGEGHSLRSDMNWSSMDEDVLAHWQKVGTFRNNHIAVGAGSNTSVDVNSGVGFVRTYSKGAVTDRVAACIGASAFTEVTMDVSSAWNAGDKVVNYYDGSSATVASDGTVTFSSGANGTILIGDPDGKPLVSVNGEAKFKGTQQVTISIEGADSASVSIDGGDSFTAHNGDKFTIGDTASEGATVTVSCEATNEKGTTSCKATFYKALESEDIEAPVIKPTAPTKTDSVTSAEDGSVTVTLDKSITTSDSKVAATVTDTVADQILDKLASSELKSVVIDATAGSAASTSVEISEASLKKLAEVEGIEITLVTDSGKIVLDSKTIASIAASAGNDGQVTLDIETVEKSNNLLKVDISISTSGGYVIDFNGGKATVTVVIDDELRGKNPVAVYIDDEGKYFKIGGTLNEDGTFTFVTGHFSTYAIMPEADADKVIKKQAISAVKKVKSTVTLSTKNVKRGIKVSVKIPASQKADKTGIIIYRSTKKNSGYAVYKKVKTSGSAYTVTNTLNVKGNRLVQGKRYYYKARVYKVIDGKTYYGPMSSVKYMRAK